MARLRYCWRYQADIPMLDEPEWAAVAEFLSTNAVRAVKAERSLLVADAKRFVEQQALEEYFELTGHRETNVLALYHHRSALYGPDCRYCGKPLRTPSAKVCACCWKQVS